MTDKFSDNTHPTTINGTDIYLAGVATVLTAMLFQVMFMMVGTTFHHAFNLNMIYLVSGLAGIAAGYHVLADTHITRNQYRLRVWSAITNAVITIVICPLTMWAQIAQTLMNGISITRNLLD
jgi:hypothetical protein